MHRRLVRLLAILFALTLVAAACGDDDGGDSSGGDETPGTEAADDGGDGEATGDGDEGGDGEASEDGSDDGEAADDGGADGEMADGDMEEMTPQYGGTLVALLEAETNTYDIPGANCAVSCISVMRAVADTLTIVNDDGEVEPFVLEAFEPNEDFTEFTLTMREGVTFHDGTVADGAAVKRNIEEMAAGPLQGQVLIDLTSVELVDDMTVLVTFSDPFSTFGQSIAERTGYLLAPSFWDDPELRATNPIGTGPFTWESWSPGESVQLVRNDDYWRTDDNGNELPFLDGIEFRPVPDSSARRAAMESDDGDVTHDAAEANHEYWRGEWVDEGNSILEPEEKETTYLMLNNSVAPFDDTEVRRALALCTNREEYRDLRSPGTTLASGPFSPGALGYLEDAGFPEFDPEAGRALLEEVGFDQTIVYGTSNDPADLVTAQLFADQWSRNCGLSVEIDQFDQAELITKALTGDFRVFLWRNHGQPHPGLEQIWWDSRFAEGLALNFGRIVDPDLDALLDEAQATVDPSELDAIGQDINRLFAENVYNVWLEWSDWILPYQSDVHGVGKISLPSGNDAEPSIAGRMWLQEAWMEQ